MVFSWDERKDRSNRRKHGLSFETAARVFADPQAISYFDRWAGSEQRWHTVGLAGNVTLVLVVHTNEETSDGEEELRIISARKATASERAAYDAAQ